MQAMFPATTWDDSDWPETNRARGWSVIGQLAAQQRRVHREVTAAHRRQAERAQSRSHSHMMTAASISDVFGDDALIRSQSKWAVIALLFTMPTSDAIKSLGANGETLDIRSGALWDLFFAGYYKSTSSDLESNVGARGVGGRWTNDWYFSDHEFDEMRRHVEEFSNYRWEWSGGTDLVLINALIPARGPITIDWESIQFGSLTDATDGTTTLTLDQMVTRLARDLERDLQDPAYGVGAVTNPDAKQDDSAAKKIMIGATAGILGAIGKGQLNL